MERDAVGGGQGEEVNYETSSKERSLKEDKELSITGSPEDSC